MWLAYLLLVYCVSCEAVLSKPSSYVNDWKLTEKENGRSVSSGEGNRAKEGPFSDVVVNEDYPADPSIATTQDLEAAVPALSYPQLFYDDSKQIHRTVHETANSAVRPNSTRVEADRNRHQTIDLSNESGVVVHRGNDRHSRTSFTDSRSPSERTGTMEDSYKDSNELAEGTKKGEQSLHPIHAADQRSSRSAASRTFKAGGGRYYPPAKPSVGYGAPNPVTPCPQTNPVVYPPPRPKPPVIYPPPPPRPLPTYGVPTLPSPKPVVYPSYPAPLPAPSPVLVFIPQPAPQQQYRPQVIQQSVPQKPWLDGWLNKPHFNPLAWKAQKAQLLLSHFNKGNVQQHRPHVYGPPRPPKGPSPSYGVPLEPAYYKPHPSPCSHPNHPYDDPSVEYVPSKPVISYPSPSYGNLPVEQITSKPTINYPSPSYVTPGSYPSYGSSVSPQHIAYPSTSYVTPANYPSPQHIAYPSTSYVTPANYPSYVSSVTPLPIAYPSPSYVTTASYPPHGSSVSPSPNYPSPSYVAPISYSSYGSSISPIPANYPSVTPPTFPSFPPYTPSPQLAPQPSSYPSEPHSAGYPSVPSSGHNSKPTSSYFSTQHLVFPSVPASAHPTIPQYAYPAPTTGTYAFPGYVDQSYDAFAGKGKAINPNYKENEILPTAHTNDPEPYQTPGPFYGSYAEPYKPSKPQQHPHYESTTATPISYNNIPFANPLYNSHFTTPQPIYISTTSAPASYAPTTPRYLSSFTTIKYPQTSAPVYPSPYNTLPLRPQVVVVTSGTKTAEPTPLTYYGNFIAPNCSRENTDTVGAHSQFPAQSGFGGFGPSSCGGSWRILGARDIDDNFPINPEPVYLPRHPFHPLPQVFNTVQSTTSAPTFVTAAQPQFYTAPPPQFYTAATPVPFPHPNKNRQNVLIFSSTRLPVAPHPTPSPTFSSRTPDFDVRTAPKGSANHDQQVKATLVVEAIRDALPFPPIASTPNSIVVTTPASTSASSHLLDSFFTQRPVLEGEISPFLFSRASPQTGRTVPNKTISSLPLSNESIKLQNDIDSTNTITDEPVPTQARLLTRELSNANLRVLARYLEKAGLIPLLNSLESFTLFAPSNLAFNELSSEFNFENNIDTLRETLLYHVVPQRWSANEFVNDLTLPTSAGSARLRLNVYNTSSAANTITVNGARMLSFDLETLHGVVHVIDKVLTPIPTQTVLQQLENSGLRRSMLGTSLATILEGPGPITVFVPSPDVFFSLSDEEQALVNNATAFSEMLWYHVVPGTHYSEGLLNGQWLSTGRKAGELQVQVSADGRQRRLVGVNGAEVVRPDVTATNGVLHIINRVLTVVKQRPSSST